MSHAHREALELARRGDWHGAHNRVQDDTDNLSCQIHGYLHRDEGDLANAAYWYRRAGMSLPDNTLEEELERLFNEAS